MLIQLSKRVLDQIYYNNKAKLCEIRIRLMGTNVDLLHAIDHPRGGELFLEYLTWERAAENLHFYRAVDKFDAMCKDVSKQYAQVQKLRQQLGREEALASLAEGIGEVAPGTAEPVQSDDGVVPEGQPSLTAADESNPASPQPLTSQPIAPQPGTPGQNTPDNRSSYENSMKQSPPKRLDSIMSASNFDPNTKSADGSARAGPIVNESEQDGTREYAIKLKPAVRGLQPRQSSFSGRVALALTEDEADDKTELYDNDVTPTTTFFGAMVRAASARGTEKLAYAPTAGQSPKDAATGTALLGALVTDESVATVQTTETENTMGARKGRHRSSFLQAKAEKTERAQEFHDRQGLQGPEKAEDESVTGAGDETGAQGQPTEAPSPAVLRSRRAKKIVCLVNTLRTQVLELNEVARVIMQSYIYNDACQQLNLPDAMRIRCERQFSQWCTDLARAPRGDIPTLPSADALDQLPSSTGVTPKGYASTQASFSVPVNKLSTHHGSVHSTYFRNAYGGGLASAVDLPHSPSEDTFQTGNTSSVQLDSCANASPHVGYSLYVSSPQPSQSASGPPESGDGGTVASNAKPAHSLPAAHSHTQIAATQPPQQLSILSPRTAAAMSAVDIDLSFIDLFKEIKNEILKLLRDDKFPRWKATQEFHKFIASIRPYDNTAVSPAFHDTRLRMKEHELERQRSFDSGKSTSLT
jgi:hypothetical protein